MTSCLRNGSCSNAVYKPFFCGAVTWCWEIECTVQSNLPISDLLPQQPHYIKEHRLKMYQVLLNHWHLNLMTVLKSLISFFFDLSIKIKIKCNVRSSRKLKFKLWVIEPPLCNWAKKMIFAKSSCHTNRTSGLTSLLNKQKGACRKLVWRHWLNHNSTMPPQQDCQLEEHTRT